MEYQPNRFSNYSSHNPEDNSYCASYYMELHKHESIDKERSWVIRPTVIHDPSVVVVVYDKEFKIVIPEVGGLIEFNHKLLHGLLPFDVAIHLQSKKRKTKEYLEWEKEYTRQCIDERVTWSQPVMEWQFV